MALVALASSTSASHLAGDLDARRTMPNADDVTSQPTVLRPIRGLTFDSVAGIHSRDTSGLDRFKPAEVAHMLFGNIAGDNEINIANMTMYAMNGLPIVMMEAFEDLTKSVDCDGNDGELSLSFESKDAYHSAISTWGYIHEDKNANFLMITNHDGCGPQGERQCYTVTDVDNDDEKLSVVLKATRAQWKEVAGSFDLDFGKAALRPSGPRTLRARFDFDDFLDKIVDKGKGVIDRIKDIGDGDLSKTLAIPVAVGQENTKVLLFEDFTTNPPKLKLSCLNCFVEGNFKTTGTIKVDNFKPKEISLVVKPENFRAAIELQAELAQKNPDSEVLSFGKTIFEGPIPGAGIVVPGIFSLGATAEFKIAGDVGLIGRGTITFGGRSSLPNGASVKVDLVNFEKSGVAGFDTIETEPVFDVEKTSLTLNIGVGPQVALALGVEVLEDTGVEAALNFGVPKLNLNVTAGFDDNGFCKEGDKVTSGIKSVSAAHFDMSLTVKGKVGDVKQTAFDRKLVLTREYQNIQKNPPPYIVAHPSESNILEWHYILTGPPKTPYENGQYWGTLIFPPNYPFAPPAIRMHTPSGRFQPSSRLCLSISDFHPKSFNPAWEVSTILIGLMSFMTSEEMTTGSVSASNAERKVYAARSRWWNSTGGGSHIKAVAGVTSTIKGIANIKAGDGGKKFRAEWPEVDEENWEWINNNRIDPATGQILPDPNVASSSALGDGSNCSPETNALRKRPGGSVAPLGAVMEGGQRARDVGESWFRRHKVWICFGMVLGYALFSRLIEGI
ncbi:hypothetical protein FQN57_001441 [Myotisia sp. PD_48]|nr:hypothetical protein FQN57_001441 [Myotisia sp. PD_48]